MERTKRGRCPKTLIQETYQAIHGQSDRHSVTELCQVYAVSRSGYYKWLGRRGTHNQYEQAQQKLDFHIADLHAHHPAMGYRQLRDKLAMETGLSVCDLTVLKSMKRLGIKGFVRKRKLPVSAGGMAHSRYPNVLNRQFGADKPMQKIVTDVTYIKHHGKWYYLALYLDLFNNEILEWELRDSFDHFLVIHPAQRLLKKVSTEHQVLLHSDQGVQYSSAGYCSLLQRYNVIQSMSRAGNPYDNAVMESFFGRFKDILRSHFRFWALEDLPQTVTLAVQYFNYERPLRKLNGMPPVQFRIKLAA